MNLRTDDCDEPRIWIAVLVGLSFFSGVPVDTSDAEWVFIFMIDFEMLRNFAMQPPLGIMVWTLSIVGRFGMIVSYFSVRKAWFRKLFIICSLIFLVCQVHIMTIFAIVLTPYLLIWINTVVKIRQLSRLPCQV